MGAEALGCPYFGTGWRITIFTTVVAIIVILTMVMCYLIVDRSLADEEHVERRSFSRCPSAVVTLEDKLVEHLGSCKNVGSAEFHAIAEFCKTDSALTYDDIKSTCTEYVKTNATALDAWKTYKKWQKWEALHKTELHQARVNDLASPDGNRILRNEESNA